VLAIVGYYLTLGIALLMSVPSSIGTPTVPDPVGFGLVSGALLYGGVLWALAAAIMAYRAFGPNDSAIARTRLADGLIIIGCGLVSAVLCVVPVPAFASEAAMSLAFMVAAAFGFFGGCGLAGVVVTRSRTVARTELPIEAGGQ
jgi:hypothetical protein